MTPEPPGFGDAMTSMFHDEMSGTQYTIYRELWDRATKAERDRVREVIVLEMEEYEKMEPDYHDPEKVLADLFLRLGLEKG